MRTLHLLVVLVICGLSWTASRVEAANIQGPKRSVLDRLEEEDAVRNRNLYRKGRISVAPALNMTLNDAYRRNVLMGVDFVYNFTDELAFGVNGFYGVAYNTSLADQLEAKRRDSVDRGAFADVAYLVVSEFVYTPIFGKAAFAGEVSVVYDMHLIGGAGLMGFSGNKQLESASPVGSIGAGMRVFLDRSMAVSVQVRDYLVYKANNVVPDIYADAGEGGLSGQKSVTNQFAFMMSYAFFFPQTPKKSN